MWWALDAHTNAYSWKIQPLGKLATVGNRMIISIAYYWYRFFSFMRRNASVNSKVACIDTDTDTRNVALCTS